VEGAQEGGKVQVRVRVTHAGAAHASAVKTITVK